MKNPLLVIVITFAFSAFAQIRTETRQDGSQMTRAVSPQKALAAPGQTYILRPKPGRANQARGVAALAGHTWAARVGLGVARNVTEQQRKAVARINGSMAQKAALLPGVTNISDIK